MQSDIKRILYIAEDHYLKRLEVQAFQIYSVTLTKRLEVYKYLRDQEIDIFQPIAVELERVYSAEDPQVLERAVKHWLSVMRYCAMAMLLNSPEYFQRSILDWLAEIVETHQMQSMETTIYDLLVFRLKKSLPKENFALLEPFLKQAKNALLGKEIMSAVTVGG